MDARFNTGSDRRTAAERREVILQVATAEFAAKGFDGASTPKMAKAAAITHSYVFKLFGTKRELFLAVTDRVYDRVAMLFEKGSKLQPQDPLQGIKTSFAELLASRDELLVLLHGFAAAGEDQEIGERVRARFIGLHHIVERACGADAETMRAFWGQSMLLIGAVAINLPSMSKEEKWIDELLAY